MNKNGVIKLLFWKKKKPKQQNVTNLEVEKSLPSSNKAENTLAENF